VFAWEGGWKGVWMGVDACVNVQLCLACVIWICVFNLSHANTHRQTKKNTYTQIHTHTHTHSNKFVFIKFEHKCI